MKDFYSAEELAPYWGYLYKLTDCKTKDVFFGTHGVEPGEDSSFFYGGNSAVEEVISAEGETRFRREIVKLISTREDAFIEETKAIAAQELENPSEYQEPLAPSSVILTTIYTVAQASTVEELHTYLSHISVLERDALRKSIREAFNTTLTSTPDHEASAITMPVVEVPD